MTEQEYENYKEFLKKLKYEILTLDDYEVLFNRLGGHGVIKYQKGDKWILYTMCHNLNPFDGSPKLEFYTDTYTLHCYTQCGCSFDIYQLIQKRAKLNGEEWNTFKSAKWICDVLGITFDFKETPHKQSSIYNWRSELGRYLKEDNNRTELPKYDSNVLDMFPRVYHENWYNRGISEETMDKYNVRYYPYRSQIVLPCYDCLGNLCGIRVRNMKPDMPKYVPLQLLNGTQFNFPTNAVPYGINLNQAKIEKSKRCWLVEAEASVQLGDTWYGNNNVALGLYGHELGEGQLRKLIEMGVSDLTICLDSDFHEIGDNEEYNKFENSVLKIYDKCKPYIPNIYVCYNNMGYNDMYKASPFDFGQERFELLLENRERIENV